jgi:hypothetical protein
LSRGADKGILCADVIDVELFYGIFCLSADTAAIPGAAYSSRITLNFGAGLFEVF